MTTQTLLCYVPTGEFFFPNCLSPLQVMWSYISFRGIRLNFRMTWREVGVAECTFSLSLSLSLSLSAARWHSLSFAVDWWGVKTSGRKKTFIWVNKTIRSRQWPVQMIHSFTFTVRQRYCLVKNTFAGELLSRHLAEISERLASRFLQAPNEGRAVSLQG